MESSDTPVATINPCVCPMCGQPNQCAMADASTDAAQTPCWCTTVVFSAELLQRIPASAQNKACVCRQCATRATPASPR